MPKMLYKTKGNTDPKRKPRVYFTCHPEDFERYFEKIKSDIFTTHDCAIYYTEDMTAAFEADHLETDLGQMNLFVVPVTWRLLSQPNRAMDADLAYAKQVHIPILPFMMEQDIDEIYSQPEKFGQRQYLNPYSTDLTEIRYEDKLKKHLESVLISDELAKRVRAAFDAYIFLSYRKKDRKYANELMKLIHKNPECRDIAIWYDEFLIPGESFAENIKKALEDSKLFALLVTPSLLEEPEGMPNFVMAEEYPAAVRLEKTILPAEMKPTDHAALAEKFPSIPPCADPQDEESFQERLLQSLHRIAITANDDDPEHNFLIGLAYLDGIDVEVDNACALNLISLAAEAELPEAMEKIYHMYSVGIGTERNAQQAIKWANKLVEHYSSLYGEQHPVTLEWMYVLAAEKKWKRSLDDFDVGIDKLFTSALQAIDAIWGQTESKVELIGQEEVARQVEEEGRREWEETVNLAKRTYDLRCEVLGEEHPDTLASLAQLADLYGRKDDQQKLRLHEQVYELRCKVLGEKHADTIDSLSSTAYCHSHLGNHQKAKDIWQEVYSMRCEILGKAHRATIDALDELADTYAELGDWKYAADLYEKVALLRYEVWKEDLSDWMKHDLGKLANKYGNDLEDWETATKLHERNYALFCKINGERDHFTIDALDSLTKAYQKLGDFQKTAQLYEKLYAVRCQTEGENDYFTLQTLEDMAEFYKEAGDHLKAIELYEKRYMLSCQTDGEDDLNAIAQLYDLACYYGDLGNHEKATVLLEKVYELQCRALGEEHEKTLLTLHNLAYYYDQSGNYEKAIELYENVYTRRCNVLGEEHPATLTSLGNLGYTYGELGRHKKAVELREKVYTLRCRTQGEDQPDTLWAKEKLDEARKKLEETT